MIEVRTRGFYKARWELSVDGQPLQVFALYLVLVMTRRAQAAAAGSS